MNELQELIDAIERFMAANTSTSYHDAVQDYINCGIQALPTLKALQAENSALREALIELVECKNLKTKILLSDDCVKEDAMLREYNRRKPEAWKKARKLIGEKG